MDTSQGEGFLNIDFDDDEAFGASNEIEEEDAPMDEDPHPLDPLNLFRRECLEADQQTVILATTKQYFDVVRPYLLQHMKNIVGKGVPEHAVDLDYLDYFIDTFNSTVARLRPHAPSSPAESDSTAGVDIVPASCSGGASGSGGAANSELIRAVDEASVKAGVAKYNIGTKKEQATVWSSVQQLLMGLHAQSVSHIHTRC
jgi:hypothetical protein